MAALHFEVVGRLWDGSLGAYQYTDVVAPEEPCSKAEGRAIRDAILAGTAQRGVPHMGDFATITDCRIVHERNEYLELRGGHGRSTAPYDFKAFHAHNLADFVALSG